MKNYQFIKQSIKSIILIFLAFAFLNVHSQDNNSNKKQLTSKDWNLYKNFNGIQIYFKQSECNDEKNGLYQELVLLKFINTTKENLKIEWDNELWYDGKCWTCKDDNNEENHYTLKLKAGESIEGECGLDKSRELQIFKRYTNHDDVPVLSNFELKNISINPL